MSNKPVVLAVDDEKLFLQLIQSHLKNLEEPCAVEVAHSGEEAWELLQANPEHYDVVLLDRMMGDMDGIELLTRIRGHWVLSDVPVILQTAKSDKQDIIEGMQAGAYYYLTKPIEKELIRSVVNTALSDRLQHKALKQTIQERNDAVKLLKKSTFEYQTIEEANLLAGLLANICKNPEQVVTGLAELLINAVEHGNLDISYDEKSKLKARLQWKDEVQNRLQDPKYKNKKATVSTEHDENTIVFTITDEGKGFDWQPYMDFDAERMMDNHGRGIAMANKLCFSRVVYQGKGNVVQAIVEL